MAFKMKNTAYYKKKFAESEMASPYNKNSNDDDVLSKEIKDTRELSDEAQEKYRRGGIGPEESPEAIAKKEKDFLEGVDRTREEFEDSIARRNREGRSATGVATEPSPEADRAMELAKEYDEAYKYKKDKGDPGKKLKK